MKPFILLAALLWAVGNLGAQNAPDSLRVPKARRHSVFRSQADSLKRAKIEAFELRVNFNAKGTSFARFNFWNQVWLRYTHLNPGSTINGEPGTGTFDIGLRRVRMSLFATLADRVFFYFHFGINNFNYLSARKTGAFIHDSYADFKVYRNYLAVGAGLSGWNGPNRFSFPGTMSIMGLDIPLSEIATVDLNDQFVRRLTVHARGTALGLDYRFALSQPFTLRTATGVQQLGDVGPNEATWSLRNPSLMGQGYIKYQLFDREDNATSLTTGTYLGKKKIVNVGAGFVYQPRAMWYRKFNSGDTAFAPYYSMSVDVFVDLPTAAGRDDCLSLYAAYMYNSFGPRYIRFLGVMNPANGYASNQGLPYSGSYGSAFPVEGTGQVVILMGGYKFEEYLLGRAGTLMPFGHVQIFRFDRLEGTTVWGEAGVSWLVLGHKAKITFSYQNRPVYRPEPDNRLVGNGRRGMYVVQLQVGI
jgi:hypothetical protein